MSDLFDWNQLNIGEEEDPKEVKKRLDKIHEDLLKERGLALTPGKNSPGFEPSAQQAREVAVMACLGLDPKDIALVLNIEHKMLKLYYGKELRVTANLANAMVARTALQMAMSGRSPDMTKFWLKARAGWQEKTGIDITTNGKDINSGTAKERLKDVLQQAGASHAQSKTAAESVKSSED